MPMAPVVMYPPKTAAIFGAGIAGLTAAHELARRGYLISVYEADAEAGSEFNLTLFAEEQI